MVSDITRAWGGRPADILFADMGEPQLLSSRRSTLGFSDPTKVTAGVQVCVQKFISLFLTRRGSAINEELGSDFMSAVIQGKIRTATALRNYFSLAVSQISEQVNDQAEREDERLAGVALEGAAVERQRIIMRIRLTTEAGASVAFLAPIERPT